MLRVSDDVDASLAAEDYGDETRKLGDCLHLVAEHPDQLQLLQDEPDRIPRAVEEILRWATPVMHFRRTATRDVELRGQRIKAGDKVVTWYISANRDEDVFPDPYRFDVTRTPNDHVTFGPGGPHFCLGAHLARLETKILFQELLPRLRSIEIMGPEGYSKEHLVEKWFRDIKVYDIFEGTGQIQRVVIGRHILGRLD